MMVARLLERLREQGIDLWVEGDRLRFRAPKGVMTPDQRTELVKDRAEIIAELQRQAAATSSVRPLSFSQRSLWFLHLQAPQSTAYHVTISMRVRSELNREALHDAVQALVDRHAILRTTYDFIDGAPAARVAGQATAAVHDHDASRLSDDALRTAIEADYSRPFDLAAGPLLRVSLYSMASANHVLLLTIHHIAADGWSLLLLFQELTKLYAEFAGGSPAGLSRPTVEYADYVSWQQQMLDGAEGERLWLFWRSELAEPRAVLQLPADHPRPETQSFNGGSLSVSLDAGLTERLKALARVENTTLFVVLLASFHAFLHRLTDIDDIIVGAPAFGRSKSEFLSVVGDFVNTVPLRVRFQPSLTIRELMRQERRVVQGALDAQEFPLPLLVERLQPARQGGRTPLVDAFFALQRFDQFRNLEALLAGDAGAETECEGLRLAAYPLDQQEGQFDFAVQFVERAGVLHGVFKYSSDMFEASTIAAWAGAYRSLVEALAADPDATVAVLPRVEVPQTANERATELIRALEARDIRLVLDGDRLRVNAPKGALDDDLKARIGTLRDDLIRLLRDKKAVPAEGSGIVPVPRLGPLPTSSIQRRLWFHDRLDPGRRDYNIGLGVRLRGRLDESSLLRALDMLVARQESLHMRFIEVDGGAMIELLPPRAGSLAIVDLDVEDEQRDAAAVTLLTTTLREAFDLQQGPLARFRLARFQDDDHVLIVVMHHAAADGWSISIAVNELLQTYQALAGGATPTPAPLRIQYADFAAWEQEQLQRSDRMRGHLQYWKRGLEGASPLLELPLDRPRPATQSFRGARLRRTFDREVFSRLTQTSRALGVTPFMMLLAAWHVLLHRYTGQDDVLVGSPVAHRSDPALEPVIGCFINNVVFRTSLLANPPFSDFLAEVRRTVIESFDHSEIPFDAVIEAVRPQRSAGHSPIFQVLFTLMSFPTKLDLPEGLSAELVWSDTGAARFDLTIELAELDGHLNALYEYATDLFDSSTIDRFHSHYASLLESIAADPSTPVRQLPMLLSSDRAVLGAVNDTTLAYDETRCVHQLLEHSAAVAPWRTAAVDEDGRLTYAELDQRANQLARVLQARGVRRGALVAICLDRSLDMLVAMAAILKAGAAYVPLDPSHPRERLRYTLEDARVESVITTASRGELLNSIPATAVFLDQCGDECDAQDPTPVALSIDPESLAYVIYTSGSTGKPKGVEITHRNLVSFLEAMRREPGMTADDVLLAVTTLSFDIAGLELWLPLMVGARVIVATRADALDGRRLIELIEQHGVTFLQATPSTWRLLVDLDWQGGQGVKALCGGEALPLDLAQDLSQRVAQLWNMYGPTETTVWSTLAQVSNPTGAIPIGHPIANTRVYVLESPDTLAPVGVPGELCIAGAGVGRGYRNRAELTAERFVQLTLPDGRVERAYRTGDLARLRDNGALEFLGRRDQQVKVRGYRIELGEIEAVLGAESDVRECVVSVREDAQGLQQLVGYVVTTGGRAFDEDGARTALRRMLPEYMVPNIFVVCDELPLTPNGKIDRKALPAPAAAADAPADPAQSDALMTVAQRRVATIWRDVLQKRQISLHDNFFDAGGHSLLLVKVQLGLSHEFGRDVPLVKLFQYTTISGQADWLSSNVPDSQAMARARARAMKQVGA